LKFAPNFALRRASTSWLTPSAGERRKDGAYGTGMGYDTSPQERKFWSNFGITWAVRYVQVTQQDLQREFHQATQNAAPIHIARPR
jgi:hypothetical protein